MVDKSAGMNKQYCTKKIHDYAGVYRQECHAQDTWNNPAALLSQERPRPQYWAHFKATHFKNSPDQVGRAQGTPTKHRTTKKFKESWKGPQEAESTTHVSFNLKITRPWGKSKRKAVVQHREQKSLGKHDNKPQICKRFLRRGKECCSPCPWGEDMP